MRSVIFFFFEKYEEGNWMNGIEELLVTFFYRSRIKINHG
jgi:hypothetical protein